MLNQWLCVLFQVSTGPVFGFAMDNMQNTKETAPPQWIRVGIWVIVSVVSAFYNVFGKNSPAGFNYVSWLMFFSGAVISFRFFYITSFLRQLSITLFLLLVGTSAELVTAPMLWLLGIPALPMNYTQTEMMLCVLVGIFSPI